MMGNGLVRVFRPALKQGIDDRHLRKRRLDFGIFKVAPKAKRHAHRIGFVIRTKLALPDDQPVCLNHHPERRPVAAHERRLVGHG